MDKKLIVVLTVSLHEWAMIPQAYRGNVVGNGKQKYDTNGKQKYNGNGKQKCNNGGKQKYHS